MEKSHIYGLKSPEHEKMYDMYIRDAATHVQPLGSKSTTHAHLRQTEFPPSAEFSRQFSCVSRHKSADFSRQVHRVQNHSAQPSRRQKSGETNHVKTVRADTFSLPLALRQQQLAMPWRMATTWNTPGHVRCFFWPFLPCMYMYMYMSCYRSVHVVTVWVLNFDQRSEEKLCLW